MHSRFPLIRAMPAPHRSGQPDEAALRSGQWCWLRSPAEQSAFVCEVLVWRLWCPVGGTLLGLLLLSAVLTRLFLALKNRESKEIHR